MRGSNEVIHERRTTRARRTFTPEFKREAVRGLRLKNLIVFVPDKYDLALSKVVRGYQHDIDAIAGIHRRHRLARKTLVERFESEMTAAIADPRRMRFNMAVLVARLYGIGEGTQVAARWGVPSPPKSDT